MNPQHHIVKIVALSEIYSKEEVTRAMEDALILQAFSSEYIANLLEQRARKLPQPGALILTRSQDLLDMDMAQPDMAVYNKKLQDAGEETR